MQNKNHVLHYRFQFCFYLSRCVSRRTKSHTFFFATQKKCVRLLCGCLDTQLSNFLMRAFFLLPAFQKECERLIFSLRLRLD